MAGRSKGKTALITGASSGIGEALAESFAADGYDIVLTARRLDKIEALAARLAQRYDVKAQTIAADLGQSSGAKTVFDAVKSLGVTIDALVNNAGSGTFGEFKASELDSQLQMMRLNMESLVALTHLFLPDLIARKGGVLNVASTAAFQPGPLMAVYYATKAFVLSFSEAIGEELAADGVTVTALCPGPTTSGFQAVADMQDSGLVKGRKLPTSADVAKYGLASFQSGKRVAIEGFANWALAQSVRLMPRRAMVALVMRLQRKV